MGGITPLASARTSLEGRRFEKEKEVKRSFTLEEKNSDFDREMKKGTTLQKIPPPQGEGFRKSGLELFPRFAGL